MPQSSVKLWVHIIFSTKNREPFLVPPYEYEIYHRMRENLYKLSCEVLALNGMEDHLHILLKLPATKSIAEIVRYVKGETSHWFNEQYIPTHALYWQDGYAALSVSESLLDKVKVYIDYQKEIHKKRSLEEELKMMRKRFDK